MLDNIQTYASCLTDVYGQDCSYDWLYRQDYQFKILALLSVLADNYLAYRGTLADMCEFLGVGCGNSRTNKKIREAILRR